MTKLTDILKTLSGLEDESHLFVTYDLIDAIEELETPTITQIRQTIHSQITNTFTMISRMLPHPFGNNGTNSANDATIEASNEISLEPLVNAQNSIEIVEEQEPKREEIGSTSVDMEENRKEAEMALCSSSLSSIEDSDNCLNQAADPLLGKKRATSLDIVDNKNANLSDSSIRERNPSAKSAILTHTNDSTWKRFKRNLRRKPKPNLETSAQPVNSPEEKKTIAEQILDVVNHYMEDVIQKHKIEDLHDKKLAELLCYAFYGHQDTFAKWKECAAPLYSALLVIFVSETMWSRFDYIYESDVADIFMSQKKKFDEASKMLLEVCHSMDFKRTRELLCERYIPREEMDSNGGTLLGLANMGNAELQQEDLFLYFFPLFGLPLLLSKSIIHFTGKKYRSGWQRFRAFHASPCGKFAWHTLLYAIYVIVFAFFVQQAHKVDNVMSVFTWWALLMLIWQALFFVETCIEFKLQDRGKQAFNSMLLQHLKVNHFYTIVHFVIVVINSVVLIAALLIDNERDISLNRPEELLTARMENDTIEAVLVRKETDKLDESYAYKIRFLLLSASEVTFLVSFVFSAIRMLRVFIVDPFFGSIVLTIRRMVQLFIYFSVILAAFWIVYGVCQIALQGRKEEHSVIWQIFNNGAFEIFGELETPLKEGSISGCNVSFNWNDITGRSVQCAVRSWLVPLVLFSYTLTTSILVINILTTLINQQYEKVSARAKQNWCSLKYQRMIEYEIKMVFPPPLTPLNIIYFFGRLFEVKQDDDHQKPTKYFYCDEDPEKKSEKENGGERNEGGGSEGENGGGENGGEGNGGENTLTSSTGEKPIKKVTLREFELEAHIVLVNRAEEISLDFGMMHKILKFFLIQ